MSKQNHNLLDSFKEFASVSPTAWHAVNYLKDQLLAHQFQELSWEENWNLKRGGHYFTSLAGSTLAAFIVPEEEPRAACILGTHTDSPALKLKPNAEYLQNGMTMFGVELYGAPLIHSWINRDLGLAGRVFFETENGTLQEALVNITNAPCVIPQLAIHLDRGVNENGWNLNKESHLNALATLTPPAQQSYLETLLHEHLSFNRLLSHDLFLYPLEPLSYVGSQKEMLAGYRLDNLCSVHAALIALKAQKASENQLKAAIFWDSEEIGSATAQGAESPFLPHLLERVLLSLKQTREKYLQLLPRSLCVSIDMAHGLHPNYVEKHEKQHQPLLGKGVVLKINAQQRYATTGHTAALLAQQCHTHQIPLQHFVVRNDMPCGSTIGPVASTQCGMPTIDIGIPQLSMHSSRELIACEDQLNLQKLLTHLLNKI